MNPRVEQHLNSDDNTLRELALKGYVSLVGDVLREQRRQGLREAPLVIHVLSWGWVAAGYTHRLGDGGGYMLESPTILRNWSADDRSNLGGLGELYANPALATLDREAECWVQPHHSIRIVQIDPEVWAPVIEDLHASAPWREDG